MTPKLEQRWYDMTGGVCAASVVLKKCCGCVCCCVVPQCPVCKGRGVQEFIQRIGNMQQKFRTQYVWGCVSSGARAHPYLGLQPARGCGLVSLLVFPGVGCVLSVSCQHCGGSGHVVGKVCHRCHGQRLVTQADQFEVNIQPGASNGDTVVSPAKPTRTVCTHACLSSPYARPLCCCCRLCLKGVTSIQTRDQVTWCSTFRKQDMRGFGETRTTCILTSGYRWRKSVLCCSCVLFCFVFGLVLFFLPGCVLYLVIPPFPMPHVAVQALLGFSREIKHLDAHVVTLSDKGDVVAHGSYMGALAGCSRHWVETHRCIVTTFQTMSFVCVVKACLLRAAIDGRLGTCSSTFMYNSRHAYHGSRLRVRDGLQPMAPHSTHWQFRFVSLTCVLEWVGVVTRAFSCPWTAVGRVFPE